MHLAPALIEALLGGLLRVEGIGQGLGLKHVLNNFFSETLERGLAWPGRGLEVSASQTLYRKQHLDIKKSARVPYRDNLVGNYSRDPIFHSYSALVGTSSLARQAFLRGKSNWWENSSQLP